MGPNIASIKESGSDTGYNGSGGDIGQYLAVKVGGNPQNNAVNFALCGAADAIYGFTQEPIQTLKFGKLRLKNAQGTQIAIPAIDMVAGDPVYQAASGQVTSSSGGGAIKLGTTKIGGLAGTLIEFAVN